MRYLCYDVYIYRKSMRIVISPFNCCYSNFIEYLKKRNEGRNFHIVPDPRPKFDRICGGRTGNGKRGGE